MSALRFGFAAILAMAAGLPFGTATADGIVAKPADPYVYVPSEAVPLFYNWTGFYVGGNIGAATTEHKDVHDHILNSLLASDFTSERFGIQSAGFAGGGFIGYQKQWSWLVLGGEVGYLWTDQSGSSISALEAGLLRSNPNSGVDPTRLTSSMRDLFLVTGKFGWNWETILAYFKAGWANGEVEFRTSTSITGVLLTTSSGRENGWTAGAGIEYALWPHIIVGVEYDYIKLDSGTRTQEAVGAGPVGTHVHAGLDTQTVMARLSYKFDSFGR